MAVYTECFLAIETPRLAASPVAGNIVGILGRFTKSSIIYEASRAAGAAPPKLGEGAKVYRSEVAFVPGKQLMLGVL